MALSIVEFSEIILAFLSFIVLHWVLHRNSVWINWPIVGMLPGVVWNASKVLELTTQMLKQNNGTYLFKGPWYPKHDFLVTSDPMNAHHILSKNFTNYPKGDDFKRIMETLGDGIFNADGDSWKLQRKTIHTLMRCTKFELVLTRTIQQKIEHGLFPVLDDASERGSELDLQEVLKKFTFDNICSMVLGFDPKCLSIGLPTVAYENAFDDMEEVAFYRHIVPEPLWKLQRWLQVGEERKQTKAWDTFDGFLYEKIKAKQETLRSNQGQIKEGEELDLLTDLVLMEKEGKMGGLETEFSTFLRDTTFNLLAAGRDTVSAALVWLLWQIATNPPIEKRIYEEIRENLGSAKAWRCFSTEELNKLVYLHGAMCETLRLYPPVPFDHKCSLEADTLPSGHRVSANTRILLSLYSMGRMEEIWGQDCMEFKPERWISERGEIVHVPSYKFIAFIAGPRSCIGKHMAFTQIKAIASAIIYNYQLHVVEGHSVLSQASIVLFMKHGLKVRLSRRNFNRGLDSNLIPFFRPPIICIN